MRIPTLVAVVLVAGLAGPPLARADVVLDWNAIMVATVSGQNPFAQARFAAITQLAVAEAVNAVTRRHRSYLDTPAAPAGTSAEAAAVAAAHGVLSAYFPGAGATLDSARLASLASIPDGPAKTAGITVGEAVARAMVAARAHDGASPPEFHMPASNEPGEWQPTASCPPAGGILLHWRNVTPFGLKSAAQFRSDPPPSLASRRYARDFAEVKAIGAAESQMRPPHASDVARFYNAVLAVATWNPAVSQVARARRIPLADSARLLALLNMAISDALVSVMETKYHYRLWRPETAIWEADADGNPRTEPDSTFVPFITTPCFPSYGSAHAAASYAARRIAEAFFGDNPSTVVLSSPAVPGVVLEYERFAEITDDIDDARVYGGIHFRFDQRAGARQGWHIGSWIWRHQLNPVGKP